GKEGDISAEREFLARAEERVDDDVRLIKRGLRLLGNYLGRAFWNGDVRAVGRYDARLAARARESFELLAELPAIARRSRDDDPDAAAFEKRPPRHREPVAAVVSRSAEHGGAAARHRAEPRKNFGEHHRPGALHELEPRRAGGDGARVERR